jgi:DNA-binding beta-propeller fold protein YncE
MLSRRIAYSLLVAGAFPGSAVAQQFVGIAAADSATAARQAWARAATALGAHDTALALREVTRAASAWPAQPAYVWGEAVLAWLVADSDATYRALDAYASLGLGRDLHNDARFAGLVAVPRFASVVARHDGNRAALVHGRVVARLDDSTFWPEGVDYDPRSQRYYVASVRHRTIAEVVNGRTKRELWPRDMPGMGAVLGVRVDAKRGVLWATLAGVPQMHGYVSTDSSIAALVRVRIADGRIERRWDLPPAPLGHVLGDLAVSAWGDVFVTDSKDPVLYRLAAGGDSLQRITSPLFRSLQGAAPAPDRNVLYVADYSHGLLRVDLATNSVTRLDDPPGTTTLGCDGIVLDRGAIIAVQNGVSPARVMRFTLDPTGTRLVGAEVLDQNIEVADEPTIGTIVGRSFVYVANGQWEKYTDDGRRIPERRLAAPVLLAVPLDVSR